MKSKITLNKIRLFQSKIWDFYRQNRRDLPWRKTTDPYKIFVSEVMLQQTQVSRVIPKYASWLNAFPNFSSLARRDLTSVLREWSGLGYNRRGRFLWESARIILEKYQGKVPSDQKLVDALPGIGEATAASIIVFSYNIPLVFIETNIRRVFIHEFFNAPQPPFKSKNNSPSYHKRGQGGVTSKINDDQLLPLIKQTLDQKNPREWYYGLMDYGSYLGKTIDNPNKKSAHYTRQSKFEGSTRQIRGQILRILLEKQKISREKLKFILCHSLEKGNPDPQPIDDEIKINKVIDSLIKDKLIDIHSSQIKLSSK